jgi:hypothetical protein
MRMSDISYLLSRGEPEWTAEEQRQRAYNIAAATQANRDLEHRILTDHTRTVEDVDE